MELEGTKGARSTGVNNALRDTLMVKAVDLDICQRWQIYGAE